MRWSSCLFLAVAVSGAMMAQSLLPAVGPKVPLLGYLTSNSPVSVRPIAGAPGAVAVGDPIPLPADVTQIFVAPGQRFGIVERAGAGELGTLQLGISESGGEQSLPGAVAQADSVAFSPSGGVALLYSASMQLAQVVTGLPLSGQVARSLDLTPLNGIPVASLAVSDDAQTALIGVSGRTSGAVWSFASGQPPRQLMQLGVPSAIRFFAGKQDAVVADSAWQQVSLIRSAGLEISSRTLASAAQGLSNPSDVEISSDQQQVWVADTSGSLLSIDLNSGATAVTDPSFPPAKLTRLSGQSVYLVTSQDNGSSGVWTPAVANARLWRLPGGSK